MDVCAISNMSGETPLQQMSDATVTDDLNSSATVDSTKEAIENSTTSTPFLVSDILTHDERPEEEQAGGIEEQAAGAYDMAASLAAMPSNFVTGSSGGGCANSDGAPPPPGPDEATNGGGEDAMTPNAQENGNGNYREASSPGDIGLYFLILDSPPNAFHIYVCTIFWSSVEFVAS